MKHRKLSAALLSMALTASSAAAAVLPSVSIPVLAQTRTAGMEGYGDNFALGKTCTASSIEAESVRAANATDGDSTSRSSRWGSNKGDGPDWIYVDLGEEIDVSAVRLFWENRKDTAYKIQTATENPGQEASWTYQKVFNDRPASTTDVITFDNPAKARYVRLYIDEHTSEDPDGGIGWNTVSIYEMEVYGQRDPNYQNPQENVALNKTAVADSVEADSVAASNATDGDTTSRTSRWGSDRGLTPHWIYVDLGKDMDVKTVRIYWENRKATAYKIETAAEGTDLSAEDAWTVQKSFTDRPASTSDKISLDSKVRARYVRLYVDTFTEDDPDGGTAWDTISIYEMQVYGGDPTSYSSIQDVADDITIVQPTADSEKLVVSLPDAGERYTAKYNGTDLEQVLDADLNIHKPVVDKTVKVSFKVTDNTDNSYVFKEVSVTVPGRFQAEEGDNLAPAILPELQEWKGHEGSLEISEATSIVYADDAFEYAANALAEDYKEMTGKTMSVTKGEAGAAANTIVFAKVNDSALGKEGYTMKIDNGVEIGAADPVGAYYATRTLLQAVMVSEDGSIPKGETRDYPTLAVRSFMLDVGRKTFTLDYIKQMAKAMAWYKYNDFQIHLNDNYIQVNQYWHVPTEDGGEEDRRLIDVYSAFRMESDIKKGGKDGAYKEDLTAKDLSYTKEEFSQFIDDCKNIGITIVPEFDMPAHSLALTKVRPDLKSPDSDLPHQTINGNRSAADHLDLKGQFDAVMEFVTEIWDEYTTGDKPVFDTPVIHIGADEYEAGSAAYRKFVNAMFDYAEGKGYKPRVWGSLSQLSTGEEVLGYKVNEDGSVSRRQIDIWNTGWANPGAMYNLGFELINITDGGYYIVPNATYYYDYLGNGAYTNALNSMGGVTIPMGDEQMAGASFAVWNDMCFDTDNGMSEYDIYKRVINSLGLFGANMWGKGSATVTEAKARVAVLDNIPGTNFGYETEKKDGAILSVDMDSSKDTAGPGNDLTLNTANVEKVDGRNALSLGEGKTASIGGVETAGLGNSLRVRVKRTSDSTDEQILFESPYGSIKAVQAETGKVGFSREAHDYSFDYTLPVNEWVELEFRNEFEKFSLYVNGSFVGTVGEDGRNKLKATMMFPIATVGSEEHPFTGYVDDIRLGTAKEFENTNKLYAKLALLASLENAPVHETLINQGFSLIGKYDPTAAEIAEVEERVDAALAGADYEKSDYTLVNEYEKLIPSDLSDYTTSTVNALKTAINGVVTNLPVEDQERVDAMAATLHAALEGLTPLSIEEKTYVAREKITASASTYQPGDDPENALDGDPNSLWHCDWNLSTLPHWWQAEFTEPQAIDQVIYTPRTGAGNGTVLGYDIQISNDGTTFETIKSGTFERNANTKTVDLDEAVTTKYVRLNITASVGNFGSAAEIRFHRADLSTDKTELQKAATKVASLKADTYKASGWNEVQAKLAAAQAVLDKEDATFVEIDAARIALAKAIAALEVGSEPVVVLDYTNLQTLVNDMTDAKVNAIANNGALKTQLASAKALINAADSQEQIDTTVNALHDSWLKARIAPSKDALNNLK